MAEDMYVLALVKGNERYVILYDAPTRNAALRQLGLWATNQELSFTWYDAAFLSDRVRKEADRCKALDRLCHGK